MLDLAVKKLPNNNKSYKIHSLQMTRIQKIFRMESTYLLLLFMGGKDGILVGRVVLAELLIIGFGVFIGC